MRQDPATDRDDSARLGAITRSLETTPQRTSTSAQATPVELGAKESSFSKRQAGRQADGQTETNKTNKEEKKTSQAKPKSKQTDNTSRPADQTKAGQAKPFQTRQGGSSKEAQRKPPPAHQEILGSFIHPPAARLPTLHDSGLQRAPVRRLGGRTAGAGGGCGAS